jgi:hypothetical protein
MKKFEYHTMRVDYDKAADKAANSLDELGKAGWELVGVLPESPKAAVLFFKRPIES